MFSWFGVVSTKHMNTSTFLAQKYTDNDGAVAAFFKQLRTPGSERTMWLGAWGAAYNQTNCIGARGVLAALSTQA
jgi:hypothetical protein